MEAVLASASVLSLLLINKNKKEYFPTDRKEQLKEINKYRVDQYPVKHQAVLGSSISRKKDTKVDYSTGELKRPSSLKSKVQLDTPDLLDMSKRPMNDFMNNHFIPNVRRSTQNMIGTGVRTGNFLPEDYNLGGDAGQLTSRLDSLSNGCDPTYMHKRASGPRFSPLESAEPIHGGIDKRPDLDRFRQDVSRNRNKESPCEKVFYVGPGTGLDPSIPASGGFNAGLNNRVTPNNVNAYRLHQLPGQVITGKLLTSELPTANPGVGKSLDSNLYGVPNNKKPPTFWSLDDRPPEQLGINSIQKPISAPNYLIREQKAATVQFGPTLIKKSKIDAKPVSGMSPSPLSGAGFGDTMKVEFGNFSTISEAKKELFSQ
jgi:hypothetical protein